MFLYNVRDCRKTKIVVFYINFLTNSFKVEFTDSSNEYTYPSAKLGNWATLAFYIFKKCEIFMKY